MRDRRDTGVKWSAFPALLWLGAFLVLLLLYVARTSSGADAFALLARGWSIAAYPDIVGTYSKNFANALLFGGLSTIAAFVIAIPVAYMISFHGRRYRNLLVFLLIAPFLTSYLIRLIAWQVLLGAKGPLFSLIASLTGRHLSILGSPAAVLCGLSYQLVPVVLLPVYTAFNRVDRNICAAAEDLYSGHCGRKGAWVGAVGALVVGCFAHYVLSSDTSAFSPGGVAALTLCVLLGALGGYWTRETFALVIAPMSREGFLAAGLLSLIPALGDYMNAALLGNVHSQMIGNVIQTKFLVELDYRGAAAASSLLMFVSFVLLLGFLRLMKDAEVLDAL